MQPLEIGRCRGSSDSVESHVAVAGRFHSSDPPLEDRATLQRWVRARTTPQRVVLRSRVVFLWRRRYLAEGCDSLTHDRPGRGRKRSA